MRICLILVVLLGGCGGEAGPSGVGFRAELAEELVRRQMEFGPRVPGTPEHAAALEWMTEYLAERADTVVRYGGGANAGYFVRGVGNFSERRTDPFRHRRAEARGQDLRAAHHQP